MVQYSDALWALQRFLQFTLMYPLSVMIREDKRLSKAAS